MNECFSPDEIHQVNLNLAKEFIESRLDVEANEHNIMLLADCIHKIECRNNTA